MKKVTQMFDGREALPVRAVPLVTDWFVTPQGLALELSKSACVRGLTAYRYWDGQAIPVRAGAWGPLHEKLIDIVRDFKRDEQGPDQHRQSARRESLKGLPADVFVWLDEFENWYSSSYISPDSVWEEQHRAVGEDDDLEPQFLPKYHDALDLFPISLGDFEPLISEGFETEASPVLAAAALPGAEMADGASDGVEPDAGQEWSPKASLERAPGYRWPLYQVLKAAYIAGQPCPKARSRWAEVGGRPVRTLRSTRQDGTASRLLSNSRTRENSAFSRWARAFATGPQISMYSRINTGAKLRRQACVVIDKYASSPINTCAGSYQKNSNFCL